MVDGLVVAEEAPMGLSKGPTASLALKEVLDRQRCRVES